MITLEKFYDDGTEALNAMSATSDGVDYSLGLMYDMEAGSCFVIKIRGKEEFKKFAEGVIDLLTGMIADDYESTQP